MSGQLKHRFRRGNINIGNMRIATAARVFKEVFRPALIMSNNVSPDSENQTGYITYLAGGGNKTLTGFHIPISNKYFNATVHIDRITVSVMLAGTAKVTQVQVLSVAPTSSTTASLYSNTDERTPTTDPTGVLDYDCDCDITDGYSALLSMSFTISATDDFEIYSIVVEYSLRA